MGGGLEDRRGRERSIKRRREREGCEREEMENTDPDTEHSVMGGSMYSAAVDTTEAKS